MKLYGWIGLLLLFVSEYCLLHEIEPFYSWFYSFAWWSYILLADNLLYRLRGNSLLMGRRQELWTMLPLSVFVWLIFEFYNLFLHNWAYTGVPSQLWLRWPGYALSFATVLPAIFITSDLFDAVLFRRRLGSAPSEAELLSTPLSSSPSTVFLLLGLIMTAAPLVWPRYFFPTIWLGPIFLLDPILEKLGVRSLSASLSSAEPQRPYSLLLGGISCGLMWEFWNFWAVSRWVYTVPFFANWKVFEMPLLGFLGFPPFALECWILYHLLGATLRRCNSAKATLAFWLTVGLFCLMVLSEIDRTTVVNFAI